MGNKASTAKNMALLNIEMYNDKIKLERDAQAATDARQKNELTKDVIKFAADTVAFVTGVPLIEPVVDLGVEVWDYFDESEEVYLNPDDYKFFRDQVHNINNDFRDYDKTRVVADIMEFGVDQAEWYKKTGGYDYETGE